MASSSEDPSTRVPKPEPDLELVPLAKLTRKTIERLAPFCQIRLPNGAPQAPLVPKTNSKILRLIQAVDTSMLVAQIGYRLSSDAAALCDPFSLTLPPSNPGSRGASATASRATTPGLGVGVGGGRGGGGRWSGLGKEEMLQTMAAHGHAHCLKAAEGFRDVQQEIYKIAAATKDNEIDVLVPPDPQQLSTRPIKLKDVGQNLAANLSLLERFSRAVMDLTTWWEWLEEELMAPNSTLFPTPEGGETRGIADADLYARWSKIKGGYLDYYNTIRVVYARYPQLFTTSSTAWQSISSVPPPPSSPGSSWDGSFEDLGVTLAAGGVDWFDAAQRGEGVDQVPGGPTTDNDGARKKPKVTLKDPPKEQKERKRPHKDVGRTMKSGVKKLGFVKLFGGETENKLAKKVKKWKRKQKEKAEEGGGEAEAEAEAKGGEVAATNPTSVIDVNSTVAAAIAGEEQVQAPAQQTQQMSAITPAVTVSPLSSSQPVQVEEEEGNEEKDVTGTITLEVHHTTAPASSQPHSTFSSSSSSSEESHSESPAVNKEKKKRDELKEEKSGETAAGKEKSEEGREETGEQGEKEKETGFAKVFAELKELFSKLGCQTGSGIVEN